MNSLLAMDIGFNMKTLVLILVICFSLVSCVETKVEGGDIPLAVNYGHSIKFYQPQGSYVMSSYHCWGPKGYYSAGGAVSNVPDDYSYISPFDSCITNFSVNASVTAGDGQFKIFISDQEYMQAELYISTTTMNSSKTLNIPVYIGDRILICTYPTTTYDISFDYELSFSPCD